MDATRLKLLPKPPATWQKLIRGVVQQEFDDLHILRIKKAWHLPYQDCENGTCPHPRKTAQSAETAPNHMKTPNLTHADLTGIAASCSKEKANDAGRRPRCLAHSQVPASVSERIAYPRRQGGVPRLYGAAEEEGTR